MTCSERFCSPSPDGEGAGGEVKNARNLPCPPELSLNLMAITRRIARKMSLCYACVSASEYTAKSLSLIGVSEMTRTL